jgi:hypothetical protein
MLFNEKLPDAPRLAAASNSTESAPIAPATPSASGMAAGLSAVKSTFTVSSADVLNTIATIYVIAYFAAALMAIVTWVKMSEHTPDLIKNLALIGVGLFVAIARSFFNVPQLRK